MDNYQGKTAVITGGAGGLGYGIATACLKEGMNVVLSDLFEEPLAKAKEDLLKVYPEAKIATCTADVSSVESIENLLKATLEAFGKVHFLFNNAGIMYPRCFENLSPADWQKNLNINVMGVVNGMSVFLPELEKNDDVAYIINTGALGAISFHPAMSAYCATKAATLLMTGCLIKELRARNSIVNVMEVLPATIFSNLLKSKENTGDDGLNELERAQKDFLYNATAATTPEEMQAAMEKYGTITKEAAGEIIMDAIKEGKNFCITHERAKGAAGKLGEMLLDGYVR